jgi:hypothetical protein
VWVPDPIGPVRGELILTDSLWTAYTVFKASYTSICYIHSSERILATISTLGNIAASWVDPGNGKKHELGKRGSASIGRGIYAPKEDERGI